MVESPYRKGQSVTDLTPATQLSPFPADPLAEFSLTTEYRRSVINGVLESYNSNYDFIAEAVQNAVDALEDASLLQMPPPYLLEIVVNLEENWLSVLDTGIGLTSEDIVKAFRPHVSLKLDERLRQRRGTVNSYRGYKGVGLTFLAYGTDDVRFHSKRDGILVKARMQYGQAWACGSRDEPANIEADDDDSPLDRHTRGTYVRIQFSPTTRPKSLAHLASNPGAWGAIIRARTAAGQIVLDGGALAPIKTKLQVITTSGEVHHLDVPSTFLYPHDIEREPQFRFLDLDEYFRQFSEQAEPPPEKRRQDGLFLRWDTAKITSQLIEAERQKFQDELSTYSPRLYAFVPYQSSVWAEMNEILAGVRTRTHLSPGLMLAVNRQRLADITEIKATRYETFSRNVFVIVHFDGAKPDQGRKTLQDEILELAGDAANRAVQYLGRQRGLLRPAGEQPTPEQRQTERDHQDWIFNVRTHAKQSPLYVPPITYASLPLTEQDVIGLFHQLSALGVFPGLKVYATSQIQTYDCLMSFMCESATDGLRYGASDNHPLGLAPFVIGDAERFETPDLTLEFKNNLDGLIADIDDPEKAKAYGSIDVCVCWSTAEHAFSGYQLEEIGQDNLERRQYPGVTHVLRKDGDGHSISVIMLKTIVDMIEAGRLALSSES